MSCIDKCFIFFPRIVNILQTVFYDASLYAMLEILMFLHKLNRKVEAGLKVSYDTFYLPELSECMDVRVDYLLWLTDSGVS